MGADSGYTCCVAVVKTSVGFAFYRQAVGSYECVEKFITDEAD